MPAHVKDVVMSFSKLMVFGPIVTLRMPFFFFCFVAAVAAYSSACGIATRTRT